MPSSSTTITIQTIESLHLGEILRQKVNSSKASRGRNA
jgi:hypothetical protein